MRPSGRVPSAILGSVHSPESKVPPGRKGRILTGGNRENGGVERTESWRTESWAEKEWGSLGGREQRWIDSNFACEKLRQERHVYSHEIGDGSF